MVVSVVGAALSDGADDGESAASGSLPGVGSVVDLLDVPDSTLEPTTSESAPERSTTTSVLATTTTEPTTTTVASTTTTSTTTTVAPPPTVPAVVDEVRQRLVSLTIADPDPARGFYDRDSFGGWSDDDADCMSTRHEILVERSAVSVTLSTDGCRVETGEWTDPFTGDVLTTADQATIDHQIPLAEAHRSGAWRWDDATKQRCTNDLAPTALNIVGGDVNQSKADKSPDRWLPPLETARCSYASAWIDMKARWALTATAPEIDALADALDTCDSETSPAETVFQPATVATTLPPIPTTLPPITTGSGPGTIELVSCEKRSEEVVIANSGGEPADLGGFVLHDDGRKHETTLGQWGPLGRGTRLTIVTGDEATIGDARVVWKRQNVWNNDGDTATLIASDGSMTTVGC